MHTGKRVCWSLFTFASTLKEKKPWHDENCSECQIARNEKRRTTVTLACRQTYDSHFYLRRSRQVLELQKLLLVAVVCGGGGLLVWQFVKAKYVSTILSIKRLHKFSSGWDPYFTTATQAPFRLSSALLIFFWGGIQRSWVVFLHVTYNVNDFFTILCRRSLNKVFSCFLSCWTNKKSQNSPTERR